jgi:poly(3-hydroxybutyrate) depolymerase
VSRHANAMSWRKSLAWGRVAAYDAADPIASLPMKSSFRLLLCLPWLLTSALAAESFPAGKAQFEFTANGRTLDVFTYRPTNYAAGPLLVVLHGMNRNADDYRDNAVVLGDRFGALIVAPRFGTNHFPAEAYQRGGVTRKGEVLPREEWTFSYIPKLVAEVRRRAGRPDAPYYLIGHSAGGQFLTRLAAFLPGGARRIVAANPGTHLFPTRDLPFQFGFGNLPDELGGDEAIKRYLAAPLTLYLGTADTGEANLDKTATAMKQGETRIERGRNCFRLAQQLARERGWPFNWSLVEAPGVGHDSRKMFGHDHVETALFTAKSLTAPPAKPAPKSPAAPPGPTPAARQP